ncbi:hypothetical protein AB0L40_12840 [Patulibacter sp. NPDC049589]|uniref:hypothetical protein n=1 Tax=Patulibacter sp. NPDC049589 TaxID=3154731 RepID=UPI0034474C74
MPRRPLLLGLAAGAAALVAVPVGIAALPSGGSSVTGTVASPCYSNLPSSTSDEPIVATLRGGGPGATFTLLAALPGRPAGSAGSASGSYDGSGSATPRITSLFGLGTAPSAGRVIDLAVRDAAGAVTPIGQTRVVNYTISVALRPRSPRSKRLVRVSGTPLAGKRLYGFVVRKGGRKALRRVSLGTGDVCGYVRRKVVVAPPGARRGAYRLYVGPGKTLRRTSPSTVVFGFTVGRG